MNWLVKVSLIESLVIFWTEFSETIGFWNCISNWASTNGRTDLQWEMTFYSANRVQWQSHMYFLPYQYKRKTFNPINNELWQKHSKYCISQTRFTLTFCSTLHLFVPLSERKNICKLKMSLASNNNNLFQTSDRMFSYQDKRTPIQNCSWFAVFFYLKHALFKYVSRCKSHLYVKQYQLQFLTKNINIQITCLLPY